MTLFAASCMKLPPEQEHFAKGYSAYNKGDFTTAILYLKPLVEAGNPAAQLLMAKMYSNGDGVPVNIGKADLLRNLAAIQVYKKQNITPGERDPMGDSLASISKRLDYYVGATEGKEAPVKDLSEILQTLDIHGGGDSQTPASDQEEGSPEPAESVHAPAAAPESSESPAPDMPPAGSSRGSDHISLGILRQAAESGDPTAMGFLSAAYAHGFYGLAASPAQAGLWAEKAQKARQGRVPAHDDPRQNIPSLQVALILGTGISLFGAGAWLWWRHKSR